MVSKATRPDEEAERADATGLRDRLASIERLRVVRVSFALFVVYAFVAASWPFRRITGTEGATAVAAAVAGLAMLLAFLFARSGEMRPAWVRSLSFAVVAVVSANCLFALYSKNDIEQTDLVALAFFIAAILSLSAPLCVAEACLIWLAWLALCSRWYGSEKWMHYFLSLVRSSAFAIAFSLAQQSFMRRYERLRMRSDEQADDLAKNLDEVKRSESLAKAMGRALSRSEATYRQLADYSLDLISRLSIQGRCLYVSPACERLLGYAAEEVLDRAIVEFIHPMDRRAVVASLAPENSRHARFTIICRLRRKDGSYGWFESECQSFPDPETGETQIVAVTRDIGERVKAERYRAVQHAIAEIEAAGGGLEESGEQFLKAICENLRWELGELWSIDDASMVLRRAGLWTSRPQRFREFCERSSSMAFAPGVGLPGLAWSRGQAIGMQDLAASQNPTRIELAGKAGLRGEIAFPLRDGPRVYGAMAFLSRFPILPDRDLLDVVEILGRQIGVFISRGKAVETFRADTEKLGDLVEESTSKLRALQYEVIDRQRLEQEVLLAAEVQRNLLPKVLPSLDGFELAAIAVPARYISGDTYDFVSPSPSVCNIFIADIAGKGIPAAMMVSSARALVRQSSEMGSLPSEILGRLNGALYPDLESAELFLTAQLVRLEMGSGRLVYSSAGHTEAVIVRAARSCERLPTTAVPIGVMRDIEIKDEEARLKPGDFLVLYSDGVTEAADSDGELFGMERFEATLTKLSSASADDIARAIASEVRSFSGNAPLSDDLTVIVLKATPRIVHLREKAVLEKLDSIVGLVRRGTLAYGDDMAGMMELAASELVTNVIVHSYEGFADAGGQEPELDLYLRLESDRIVLDILDVGKPFDPESRDEAEPSPLGEGGRGLRIIRSMVDEMIYSPGGSVQGGAARRQDDLRADANHWRLVKYVKGGGA